MAVSNGTIKDIVSSLKTDTKVRNSTYQAEVTRIDKQTGVAYVRLAGSDRETPTELTAAEVKKGDSVTVEWRNNKLYIGGNYSSPSVGTQRILIVEKDIGTAQQTADTANETAKTAKKTADTARQIAGNTDQYFWHTETGTDTGAHITEVPKEDFEADPTNGGGNLLARSNGIAVRDGLTELATFGASGAQIGQSGAAHSVIDANGQRFYASDGSTELANIGYGEGVSQSGTATAPYYTFGTRSTSASADRGNYSSAEGFDVKSSGYCSHAEGLATIASGTGSHAEGTISPISLTRTTASGHSAHAEGMATTASGDSSHAEGIGTVSSGTASHAQNSQTTAAYDYQTVMGRYNNNKSTNALEIGNGTSSTAKKNIFEVAWTGDITVGGHSSPIGDVQSASWTATSSAASTTNLTDEITLTPGTWMIVVSLPTVSRTHQYMLTNISSAENKYYSAVSMGTFTCIYQATSTTTTRVRSAAATSTTYSNITRGHIEAVRIA